MSRLSSEAGHIDSREPEPPDRGELFPSGHSNGKGADVRRYVAAAQRQSRPGQPQAPKLESPARAEPSPSQAPRSVFSYAKEQLATLPSDAGPELIRLGMDAIIESLVNDGTWPQPLFPTQGEVVGPGFERPPFEFIEREGGTSIVPADREAVQAWVDAGGLDAFRSGLNDFARAINKRFPPGHPQRAVALAAGYEAFAAKFYVHGGKMAYDEIGTDRAGLDWADLVSAPNAFATKELSDTRTRIDCLGYDMLATEFFRAAGMKTHSTTSMLANMLNAHKQGIAVDGATQVGFSNGGAFVLPAPSTGRLGAVFLDQVREQLGRPSLTFSPEVFDSAAVRMQNEARRRR
ncbi:MAG: hypothetical protein AAF735_07430 [Myxococcota bacterium]